MVRSNDFTSLHITAKGGEQGFTLMEVVTVVLIMGVVAAISFPSVTRFLDQQKTKSSIQKIAGLLDEARSRAITEATPQLVYINPTTVDAQGHCGPLAVLVRDSDRSYTITDGDQLREVELDADACRKVELFGEATDEEEVAAVAEVPMPAEDHSGHGGGGGGLLGGLLGGVVEVVEEVVETLLDPNGNPIAAPAPTSTRVADAVVNGSTFPVDEESGRPVIAFSERGIPVDPQNPTNWGSGAGAVYLTDQHASVYAAVVQPLGAVNVRVFDRSSGDWR